MAVFDIVCAVSYIMSGRS